MSNQAEILHRNPYQKYKKFVVPFLSVPDPETGLLDNRFLVFEIKSLEFWKNVLIKVVERPNIGIIKWF